MPLIAVMGPMTGSGDASGELAVFLAMVAFMLVVGLSYWLEYRKLPRDTQNNRDEHDE
jgi:ABC-type nickel/cobalt efflux system permease component RcnA